MNPISVTYAASATGAQTAISVDWRDSPNGLSYEVSFDGAAAGSITIETTLDDVNSVLVPVTPIWTAIGSAITSDTRGVITGPIQFVRVNIGSLSGGTLTFKLLEGAPDGGGGSGGGGTGGTVDQGDNGTNAEAWWVQIGDTSVGPAAVKAASTAPVATDKALVVALSPNGQNANGQATMANSSPVVIASNQTSIPVAGDVAADAVDSGFPLKVGGKAATALPTAVAAADRVDALLSVLGELVVVPALRGSKGKQTTVITTSTAETTIVTAGAAGVFNDLYGLILSNISATPVTATLKDGTAGTTLHIFNVGATSNAGFMLDAGSAIPQAAAAANWTLTCSASITSLEVVALFVARKA